MVGNGRAVSGAWQPQTLLPFQPLCQVDHAVKLVIVQRPGDLEQLPRLGGIFGLLIKKVLWDDTEIFADKEGSTMQKRCGVPVKIIPA